MRLDVDGVMRLEFMNKFLKAALKEAYKAYDLGECPIGAVIVQNNKIIARAYNLREKKQDPLGHAEILAISKASKKLNTWRLEDCELYVTLEPCLMCAGAIINSRIKKVYFGAIDEKNGAVVSKVNSFSLFTHKLDYEYLKEDECSSIITNFFRDLRYDINLENIYLETDRLILRPFKEDDLDDFYEYARVEGVGEMAGWSHHTTIETTKMILANFIKEKDVLAIVYKENNKVIGSIGLHKKYIHEFQGLKYREIGYVLSKDYHKKGIMTEALNTYIPFIFTDIKLDLLRVRHFDFNIPSKNVILKQGFIYYKMSNDKTVDKKNVKSLEYYLTKEDYKKWKGVNYD